MRSKGCRFKSSILPLAGFVLYISEFNSAGRCPTNWDFNFILQYLFIIHWAQLTRAAVLNALTFKNVFLKGCILFESEIRSKRIVLLKGDLELQSNLN